MSSIRQRIANSPRQFWLVIGLIAIGCFLRLIWSEDMKWKDDEIWMFETARAIVTGHLGLPGVGMVNSAGFVNPAASVWSFVLLAWVAPNPVIMVQWVEGVNVLAIVLFALFILWKIPPAQKLTWLWGMAIASVNPIAILFSRKIWAQNLLPPFCFLIFLGHWYRQTKWGAFLWGLVGTLVGQVHLSGFFWQAALFLGTLGQEFRQPNQSKTVWSAWIGGSILGAIPLLPWVQWLVVNLPNQARSAKNFLPEFYLQWLTTGWGLNLEHEMDQVFWGTFLAEPKLFGIPSYGMAIAHLFLAICGLAAIGMWGFSSKYRQHLRLDTTFPALSFYLKAGALGMGILMTAIGLRVPIYYLTILFPFTYLWVVILYRTNLKLLTTIAFAQLFISLTFLIFVHQNGGIPEGNYGVAYHRQNYQVKY